VGVFGRGLVRDLSHVSIGEHSISFYPRPNHISPVKSPCVLMFIFSLDSDKCLSTIDLRTRYNIQVFIPYRYILSFEGYAFHKCTHKVVYLLPKDTNLLSFALITLCN